MVSTKLKRNIIATSILLASSFSMHNVYAVDQSINGLEQYISIPGTRAMGMAGAYVAYASDSSAIWYNPAGLVATEGYSDLTIEYGDFVEALPEHDIEGNENTDKYTTDTSIKYAAWSSNGFGIAYFKPYNFRNRVMQADESTDSFNNPIPNNIENRNMQEYQTSYAEMKFSGGWRLNSLLSFGLGFDLINQSITCEVGCEEDYTSSEDSFGFGYSAGVLADWTFMENSQNPLTVKGGVNFRSAAEMDDLILFDDIEQAVITTRPQSLSYGAALELPFVIAKMPFTIGASLHLETLESNELAFPLYIRGDDSFSSIYDTEVTETSGYSYGSYEQEEDRTAFGLELQSNINPDLDLFLRLGSGETDVVSPGYTPGEERDANLFTDINTDYVGSNTKSTTFGIGVRYKSVIVDFASESRKITPSDPEQIDGEQEVTLTAFSLSYTF